MKKLLIFLILISSSGYSQTEFEKSIKIGGHFTEFIGGGWIGGDIIGLHIGLTVEYKLNNSISIQSELLYTQKKGGMNIEIPEILRLESKLGYIDLPLLMKIYPLKNFSLNGGMQIGYLIHQTGDIKDSGHVIIEFNNSDYNKLDISLNSGLTYRIEKLYIQTRYSHGLNNVFKNYKLKNRLVSLSIGYIF